MRRLLFIAVISIALAACTSTKFTVESSQFYGNMSDAAYITIMRKSAITAGGGTFPIELDGKDIADIGSGDYIRFPVSPGKHYLAVGWSFNRSLQTINAEPKEEYFLRIRIDVFADNGLFVFEKLTPTEGKDEIRSGDYDLVQFKQ